MRAFPQRSPNGFTLVELLVVIAIMGILLLVGAPAFHLLKGSGDFERDSRQVKDLLDIARAHAKARNTYVYVGIAENSVAESPAGGQSVRGTGRLVIAVMASKDGTNNLDPDNLSLIRKIDVLDHLHLAAPFAQGQGSMERPQADLHHFPSEIDLFSSGTFSATLGPALYRFQGDAAGGIIPFNPEGIPLLGGQAVQWIEIDLQPTRGDAAPAPPGDINKGVHAAVVIDGSTGTVRLYHP